jgi:hypothetical protein
MQSAGRVGKKRVAGLRKVVRRECFIADFTRVTAERI